MLEIVTFAIYGSHEADTPGVGI